MRATSKRRKKKHPESGFSYRLSLEDNNLYIKLNQNLLVFVAQKLGSKFDVKNRDDFLRLSLEEKVSIRNELMKRINLIDEFVDSNPFNFTPSELEIIRSWKNHVNGTFFVVNYTENGAIFLEEADEDPKAYLVLALRDPLWEITPVPLPARLGAVLLRPFKGRIVYDGMINADRVFFGSGIARSIRAACNRAIMEHGLVKSLPYEDSVVYSEEEKLSFHLSTRERREENGRNRGTATKKQRFAFHLLTDDGKSQFEVCEKEAENCWREKRLVRHSGRRNSGWQQNKGRSGNAG